MNLPRIQFDTTPHAQIQRHHKSPAAQPEALTAPSTVSSPVGAAGVSKTLAAFFFALILLTAGCRITPPPVKYVPASQPSADTTTLAEAGEQTVGDVAEIKMATEEQRQAAAALVRVLKASAPQVQEYLARIVAAATFIDTRATHIAQTVPPEVAKAKAQLEAMRLWGHREQAEAIRLDKELARQQAETAKWRNAYESWVWRACVISGLVMAIAGAVAIALGIKKAISTFGMNLWQDGSTVAFGIALMGAASIIIWFGQNWKLVAMITGGIILLGIIALVVAIRYKRLALVAHTVVPAIESAGEDAKAAIASEAQASGLKAQFDAVIDAIKRKNGIEP